MRKKVIFLLGFGVCFAEDVNLNNIVLLNEIVVTDLKNSNSFSSSKVLNKQDLNLITSKDGSITEYLKTNPNITFSKRARSSTESGEISPKDISINGASHYQNNFMVDNFNFNDDINLAGYTTLFKNTWRGATLGTQAINLNGDLLENIEVFDSTISAKYGDFQGGVIKSKRKIQKLNLVELLVLTTQMET